MGRAARITKSEDARLWGKARNLAGLILWAAAFALGAAVASVFWLLVLV